MDSKRIRIKYDEQLYTNIFDKLFKMAEFFEKQKLWKLTQKN